MKQIHALLIGSAIAATSFPAVSSSDLPIPTIIQQQTVETMSPSEVMLNAVYKRMADKGMGVGTYHRAKEMWDADKKEAALQLMTQVASAGSGDASFFIAELLWVGAEVARDPASAIKWYDAAVGQGSHAAALRMANIALTNVTSEASLSVSDYLRFAASNDGPVGKEASALLGFHILSGTVSGKSSEVAYHLRRASDAGDEVAAYNLAVHLLGDKNKSEENITEAEMSLLLSAEKEHAPAAFLLGRLYAKGANGFSKNTDMARQYLLQAVNSGVSGAAEEYKKLPPQTVGGSVQGKPTFGFKSPVKNPAASAPVAPVTIEAPKPVAKIVEPPKPAPKPKAKAPSKTKATTVLKPGDKATVVAKIANVRIAPNTKAVIIDKLIAGSQLVVKEYDKGWFLVKPPGEQQFSDGSREAWIFSSLLRKS